MTSFVLMTISGGADQSRPAIRSREVAFPDFSPIRPLGRLAWPAADFFTRFGFFMHQSFLDPELCLRMRSEMMAAPIPATLAGRGALQGSVYEATRRTSLRNRQKRS